MSTCSSSHLAARRWRARTAAQRVVAQMAARLAVEGQGRHKWHSRARGAHGAGRLRAAGRQRPAWPCWPARSTCPTRSRSSSAAPGSASCPGVPSLELDPDLVLLIFLPPLLYGAAFFTSLRDLRRNARADRPALDRRGGGRRWSPSPWWRTRRSGWAGPRRSCSGAIVSPTDAVAPAEILRRIGAPRRLLTVVEGENLTNDWTALVLYKFAVAAVVSGSFSLCGGGAEVRLERCGRPADRADRRPRDPRGAPPHRRPADGDHDLAAVRLRGLPARGGAGRVGRDRGRDRRHLHGLAHARADHAGDAAAGRGDLGGADVPAERPAVPAGGLQLPDRDRQHRRPHDRGADRAGGC